MLGMVEQRAITLDFLPKFVSKMAREKNWMVVHNGLENFREVSSLVYIDKNKYTKIDIVKLRMLLSQ